MEGLLELTNALSNGTIPDLLRPPLPQNCGFATPTQNSNRYYLRNRWSYGLQICQVHSQGLSKQKSIKNFGENRAWAYPVIAQIFWILSIISWAGKATNFKFCTRIHRIDWKKSPLKISGKVAVGVLRDSRKFSRHPKIGRIARSSLW